MAFSGLSLLFYLGAGLIDPDIMVIFSSGNAAISNDVLKTFMVISILIYSLYSAICFLFNHKLLKKGVDVL
jgi:hypothetical protein